MGVTDNDNDVYDENSNNDKNGKYLGFIILFLRRRNYYHQLCELIMYMLIQWHIYSL